VTIETFDNFKYVLKIGKLNGENYPVMVSVSADLVKERQPGKDEKPEDKTKLDEEFKTKLKGFEDKLAAEKKFEGRPYLIAKYTIEQLLKDRSGLLAEKKPETPPGATPPTSATPPAPGTPPATSSTPAKPAPVTVTTPPITVTTPPVAAPPLPKPGTPKPKIEAVTPPVTIPPETKPAPAPTKPGVPASEKRAKSATPAPEKPATPPANTPPIPEPLKPETLKGDLVKPEPPKAESPKPAPEANPEKSAPPPDKGN
jgi:hypothetical protein